MNSGAVYIHSTPFIMNQEEQGKIKDTSRYSEANRRRWANPEYKNRVSKAIGDANRGKLLGRKRGPTDEKIKQKIRDSQYHSNLKGTKKNEKNPAWKGEDVGYTSLHIWVNRNFEGKNFCEICLKEAKLEWSNKDHKYSRNREDWQLICRSCHRRFDNDNN